MAGEGQGEAQQAAPEELPPFVTTDADRQRWSDAGVVARESLGADAPAEAIWSAQRVIYNDRESFPD